MLNKRLFFLSFYRKVKYFFYLKFSFIFRNFNFFKVNRSNLEKIKGWRKSLINNKSLLQKIEVDFNEDVVRLNAKKIVNHEFYLLGINYFDNNNLISDDSNYKRIDWQFDPSSKTYFDKDVWYRFASKDLPIAVDIKYPWELSRFQHFIILGQAYRITKDELYAKEYKNQILDWINHNKVKYGVNWSCTMEVGIRVSNWLISLLYFIESPEIDDIFLNKLLDSVFQHGNHISNNLENLQTYTSNHYVANISGLFIIAAFIPNSNIKSKWLKFSINELEIEILNQTYASGWQHEASSTYHRLVTEMFLYSFAVADQFNVDFSNNYFLRLKKMIMILENISKSNGNIPQIGDNDSGRFIVFNSNENFNTLNIHYILQTAKKYKKLDYQKITDFPVFDFKAGRFLWKNNNLYFHLVAGPKGQGGNGGHSHNDVFSYELNIDGIDLLVDPGSFSYTGNPLERNNFRSIHNHNTLSWREIEPCSLKRGLFTLPEEGNLIIEDSKINGCMSSLKGIYEYKERFHRRETTVDTKSKLVKIEDYCSDFGATINFVLAPGIIPKFEKSGFWLNNTWFFFKGIKSFTEEYTSYSSAYGIKNSTILVRAHLIGTECTHIIYY